MTILLHRAVKIGDNVVAIKAIYAIKALYPTAHLIVATNAIGTNLYANLPFIDTLINVDTNPNAIYDIQNIDFFIITHRISAIIALAKSTNAKKIIVRAHLRTLLSPRFINDFNFMPKSRPESENILRLVRLVDRSVFDSGIKGVDFSKAKLRFTQKNSDFVEAFLAKNANGEKHRNLANFNGHTLCQDIIGVNFFGSGGVGYFSLEIWREIVESLAREFDGVNFIVLCPPTQKLESFIAPNVAIFVNNSDLLNLVAMSAAFCAFISVDTGNVHIADNLKIPTLGIYTRQMIKRWRGGTYGGKFVPFIMRDLPKANDTQYKKQFLDYATMWIPTMLRKKG